MCENLGQHANFEIPVGAVDAGELADAVGIIDDVADVGLALVRTVARSARFRVQHAVRLSYWSLTEADRPH